MKLNRTNYKDARRYPERIIQFGEGNFLRAFVDWLVFMMDKRGLFNGSVVVVKPRPGKMQAFAEQDNLYQVLLRGIDETSGTEKEERCVVDVISRCVSAYDDFDAYLQLAEQEELRYIISNTTEAGIVFDESCRFADRPASSFPGKLTQLLYRRYQHFNGDTARGYVLMPCELIFGNGTQLRECVMKYVDLWQLGDDFARWIAEACVFCNTLVDRIVPGYPKDEILPPLEYDDQLAVMAERYLFWAIEAPEWVSQEFPVDKLGDGVRAMYVADEEPYHQMKVGLLNAPHTVISAVGLLAGLETVRDVASDALTREFLHQIVYDEILPYLAGDKAVLDDFAPSVQTRFLNPSIKHMLKSIMLNAPSKYVARVMPALQRYQQANGKLPRGLVVGLAALIICEGMQGRAEDILSDTAIWGCDLSQIPGLADLTQKYIDSIRQQGIRQLLIQA